MKVARCSLLTVVVPAAAGGAGSVSGQNVVEPASPIQAVASFRPCCPDDAQRGSDGVNTTEVDSELFHVSRKTPLALITHPRMAAVYSPGEPIPLQGFASDAEDGMLPDETLAWNSSLDGPLGTGASLFVDTLSPGYHVITLTATDSDGQVGTASVEILVFRERLYLPIIRRGD